MKTSQAMLMSAIILGACASQPESQTTPAPDPATLVPAVNVVPESGLGPQPLEPKECGLFLWSKTDPSQFIFFEKAQTGRATMKIGPETVEVVQTINRGTIFGQFMTEQGFAAPGGEQVLLTFEPGEELQGGQRIESGRLTITTGEGWRTLIPVLGVRACQTQKKARRPQPQP